MPILNKIFVLCFVIFLSVVFILNSLSFEKKDSEVINSSLDKNNNKQNSYAKSLVLMNQLSDCSFLKWFDPNTNDEEGKLLLKNCSSCHMSYYHEWINDKHSMSQNNPFFLSIYGGTDKSGNENIYPGFKLDHPDQNGNCALCHNPEAVFSIDESINQQDFKFQNFNIDLREVKSKKTNGISCDFCHKIESIDQNRLKQGVSGLNIARAVNGKEIIFNPQSSVLSIQDLVLKLKDIRFGPLKDPIQPGGKKEELRYNSLYKTSLVCAKCHDGFNGNAQTYSTFTEWTNSPAAKRGVQCQSCHMAPREQGSKGFEIVDNPEVKHKKRPYYQIHNHGFLTDAPIEFRKKYVDLRIEAEVQRNKERERNILIVKTIVENNNFGHSFPSGSSMRNAILFLEVKDKNGKELKLVKGPKLSNYAGDLNNKPGKLFAKILAETSSEYASTHDKKGIAFRKSANKLGIPAEDWWNVFIASDTRIKATESDISIYEFDLPEDVIARSRATKQSHKENNATLPLPSSEITITAKLIWRNTWTGLAKLKGFKLQEDLLKEIVFYI